VTRFERTRTLVLLVAALSPRPARSQGLPSGANSSEAMAAAAAGAALFLPL